MKLFFTYGRWFGDSPHPHACCSILWIFISLSTCTIIHLCLHLVSTCTHIHIRFQFLVGGFGEPWPKLCLTKIALGNPKMEGFVFPSRNVYFFSLTIIQSCIVQFWGTVTASPKNCVVQSLSLQPFPTEIVHCVIPAISSQVGLCIVQFQ